MACIDRINIPQSLLPLGSSTLQQTKAIGTLKGYAFITERQQSRQQPHKEKYFEIHRLVHMASIWWLKEHSEWVSCVNKVVSRLKGLVPYGGHENKEVWIAYLPHAVYMAASDRILDEKVKASLLARIRACQIILGQYYAAEATYRQCLLIEEETFGKEHSKTLASMGYLAIVLQHLGKYEAAEEMNRQTLAGYEKVFRNEHHHTLTSMNNLGLILQNQGKYEAAEEVNRQALAGYGKSAWERASRHADEHG
jgi:tetratricopeptide (TPR) repeat protein